MVASDIAAIFAVCFTGNMARHERLVGELERVWHRDPYVIWGFPTPYEKFVLSRIPHIKDLDSHPGSWGVTLSHYRAVKIAFETGLNNVLVVEDDCRFMNDVSAVHDTLMRAPKDYDFLMLDSFYVRGEEGTGIRGWNKCRYCNSTACYLVNRRAMRVLIDMYESPVSGKYSHPMMRNSDHWTDERIIGKGFNIYCASPNLAVQCVCPGVSNYGDSVFRGYRMRGINLDSYASY